MHILITRQIDQSKNFSNILDKLNIKNTIFPVISIKSIQPGKHNINNLKNSDFVVFTSQNSVTSLFKNIDVLNLKDKKIAAIGSSTKKLLNSLGIEVNIFPKSNFTSESLYEEIKNNDIRGKKIAIIKGLGGREYLKKQLSLDNHVYDDINVYSRNLPDDINSLPKDKLQNISHICITSIDVLRHFLKIIDILKISIHKNIIFVAGNEKIANKIKENFVDNEVSISLNPTNEAMLHTILN